MQGNARRRSRSRAPTESPITCSRGSVMTSGASDMGSLPLYHWHEMQLAALQPIRAAAGVTQRIFRSSTNPLAHTVWGKSIAAGCELLERTTRRYGKPDWGIGATLIGGEPVAVTPRVVWERPFCK